MTFIFKRQGFNDSGARYEGKVVGRFVNGWRVEVNGEPMTVLNEDIKIIRITEKEKRAELLL